MNIRSRRVLLIGVAVVLVIAVVVALFLLVWSPPLMRQARTCIGCVEWHTPNISRVTASQLSGTYTFSRDISYMLELEEGEAFVDGQSFSPGCYTGDAREGSVIRFEGARGVHLEAPAPGGACP